MYCGNRDPVTCVMIDERSNGYRFASSNMAAQIYLWHLEMQTPIQVFENEKKILKDIITLIFLEFHALIRLNIVCEKERLTSSPYISLYQI